MGGIDDSRSRVIEQHLPLVRSIAGRYARRGEPLEDLVQVGTVGLIKAVDRFDPARHRDLAALARPSIEGEIRHHLRAAGAVHVPRTDHELAARVHAAREQLLRDGHARPTTADLAAALGVEEAQVIRALQADEARRAGPLAEGVVAAVARSDADAAEARVLLDAGWSRLDERERRLLDLRYRQDRSQAQIARELGLSQAHISRLLRAALDHLREIVGADVERGSEEDAVPGPVPVRAAPSSSQRPGRLLLRLPRSLHGALAEAADRDGVPLNTFIAGKLAAAIGWHEELDAGGQRGDASVTMTPHPVGGNGAVPDRSRRLLVLNLVVVGIVAILGLALLLVALLGS